MRIIITLQGHHTMPHTITLKSGANPRPAYVEPRTLTDLKSRALNGRASSTLALGTTEIGGLRNVGSLFFWLGCVQFRLTQHHTTFLSCRFPLTQPPYFRPLFDCAQVEGINPDQPRSTIPNGALFQSLHNSIYVPHTLTWTLPVGTKTKSYPKSSHWHHTKQHPTSSVRLTAHDTGRVLPSG